MLDVKTRRNLSRHKSSCRDTRNRKKAEILSRQGILCCDKKLKSNIGRILREISLCCDIRKNRRRNLCCDIKSLVATLIITTWKILLRHCMNKLCRDEVMNVEKLEDNVFGPDRETKSRQLMLT